MRSICALSASSACSVRRLSLPVLSAPSSLSGCALTHAKHQNGAKHDVEVRKPFLKPGVKEEKKAWQRIEKNRE